MSLPERNRADSRDAVTSTNCAECSRIKVRVNRTFFFYSKDKYSFIFAQKRFNDPSRIFVTAGIRTENSRELRRRFWRHEVSRPGSSLPVACDYRLGKLFSHPLRVLPRPRSGLPQRG